MRHIRRAIVIAVRKGRYAGVLYTVDDLLDLFNGPTGTKLDKPELQEAVMQLKGAGVLGENVENHTLEILDHMKAEAYA